MRPTNLLRTAGTFLLVVAAAATTAAGQPVAVTFHAGEQILAADAPCTSAFAFTDGTDRYLATAGHCIAGVGLDTSPRDGEHHWADSAAAPVVTTLDNARIGTVLYAVEIRESDEDFAIIRVNDNVVLDPAITDLGAPTAVADAPNIGDGLTMRGYGQFLSAVSPARDGLALGHTPTRLMTTLPVINGDSGGPVIDADGNAVGIVAGIGAGVPITSQTATAANGTRVPLLAPALARFTEVTGITLELLTA